MTKLSRRHLVAGGLAGAGASVMPAFVDDANAAVMTRYNLTSANGQVMLKKYAAAVRAMMALPPTNPLSWTFQWYTHGVPTNTTKAAALNAIFGPGSSPNKTLATAMWNTCQGHFGQEMYFCPWHRMYVCFFESIIRKVLNDNTFTLPYWNYSVATGYPLPKEFRMQNDPVWGPLYRPNRRSVVNAGQPIFTGMGSAMDLSPTPALSQANYLPSGVVGGFNRTLDQGLHGNVHVFVGNGQGMGSVPWAANDPIFYMHHCNIDRIWTSWNNSGHGNPNMAVWLNKTFVFAGQNGQQVTALVKDYTNTVKCNYRYDQIIAAPMLVAAAPAVTAAVATAAAAPTTIAQSGPVELGAAPVRVNVQGSAAAPAAAPASGTAAGPLAASLSALPENRRLYLVLNNVKANAPPEAVYRVYLDLPDGPPSDPLNSHYVGTFNLFDAVPHGDDHAGHGEGKPITFDVTNIAANLTSLGLLRAQHSVTIAPSNEPAANTKPVVGSITFVQQ